MPGFGFLGGDGGGEHGGAAIGGENGAVSLAGDAPGFELERAARPFDLYSLFIEHDDVPCAGRDAAGAPSPGWR